MNIRLDAVTFRYLNGRAPEIGVFADLSLSVPSSQCLGILGREGSGKSTLLHMLCGLETPQAGRVFLDGVDMTGDRVRWARARMEIGLFFQFPEHQFFAETVRDELLFGIERRGRRESEVIDEGSLLLEDVGLDARAIMARSPFTLSMGEARRVALAIVLLHRPRLLLVDEITAGLDAKGIQAVIRALSSALKEGSTIIAVSHDADFLAEIAERVVILEAGGIARDGEASEILTDESLLGQYGYAAPQSVSVARELRGLGLSLPRRLYREGELIEAAAGFRRSET